MALRAEISLILPCQCLGLHGGKGVRADEIRQDQHTCAIKRGTAPVPEGWIAQGEPIQINDIIKCHVRSAPPCPLDGS